MNFFYVCIYKKNSSVFSPPLKYIFKKRKRRGRVGQSLGDMSPRMLSWYTPSLKNVKFSFIILLKLMI